MASTKKQSTYERTPEAIAKLLKALARAVKKEEAKELASKQLRDPDGKP